MITMSNVHGVHNTFDPSSAEYRVDAKEIVGGTVAVLSLSPLSGETPIWEPGAHIDLVISDDLSRQYSLCGDPLDRNRLRIGVLREPTSRGGSEFVHASLDPGDTVMLRGPRNNFPLVNAASYLFVAGGIGITPLLPMIAAVEAAGKPWQLIYGGRTRDTLAFVDELGEYGDRVTLWPQDERGHIPIADLVGSVTMGQVVYTCGPEPLLKAMEQGMAHWPKGSLHLERFRAPEPPAGQVNTEFEIYLDYSDVSATVAEGESIVDALERVGVEVMTSCREGTCGTCETVVLAGIPDHRDYYLSDAEKNSNEVIMVCCSRAKTPRLVLDL
jgi:ferredoxin-NADP reductase